VTAFASSASSHGLLQDQIAHIAPAAGRRSKKTQMMKKTKRLKKT
jgi:hypothetical protein